MSTVDATVECVESRAQSVSWRAWAAVWAMALGTFAMATVEGMPVGLLSFISGDFDVSTGLAGLSVTVPGLVAAATAPLLPLVIRALDRRTVLLGLAVLIVLANLLTAVSPNFEVLLASRFIVGVCIGGFWSLAALVAVRLVPEAHIPRALAITFTGATVASVVGVPAAALIGSLATWRAAFLAVAALAVLVAVAVAALLPPLPATRPIDLRLLVGQLARPGVRGAVLATLLLVGGHYAAFTFVSPALLTIGGVDRGALSPLLFGFGVAAVVGTLTVGSTAGRSVRASIIGLSLVFAVTLASFPLIATTPLAGAGLLLPWGLAFGGVPVAVQTWIVKAAGPDAEAATALNTSAFNFAIAFGALIGGVTVDAVAVEGVFWLGAALVGTTALVAWLTARGVAPAGARASS